MTRTAVAVSALHLALALLLVPVWLLGQEPTGDERSHTVQAGETLSGIAEQRLGSASQWMRILDANRDQIMDPHRIVPGMRLVLPGTPGSLGATAATVTGVQVEGRQAEPPSAVGDVPGYLVRRELTRYRAFEPGVAPEVPVEQRTVFYGDRGPDDVFAQVILQPPEEIAAVPRAVFHAAGWLLQPHETDVPLGELIGFAGDQDVRFGRDTVHPYDEVRIRVEGDEVPVVGDEFLAYRIRWNVAGVGDVAAPSGRLRVTRVDEAGVVGQLVQEYDRIQIGHLLTHIRTFPLDVGVHPMETDARVEGSILTFQDRKELYLPGDYAFINLGEAHGLSVGDELTGLTEEEQGWSTRPAARLQVVGVRQDVSTVRLTSIQAPGSVRAGMRVILDRRMP